MLRVGLTGGIGAGKSAVAQHLADLGAVIIDADRLAREVVEPGTPGLAEVTEEFGTGVLDAAGALDRTRLAELVFADGSARRRLERIVHPRVRARTAELTGAAAPDAVVVNDVPLLVEAGLAAGYHLVLVVHADPEVRVARLTGRGMDPAAARARIAAQATDAQRRAAADVLLDNSGSLAGLHGQLDALWTGRLVPYERNLRRRRPARRPERLRLVDPDPGWPDQYRRIAARLDHALGDRVPRIDHVGSTAVPGLIAKDVLDVQITVPALAVADDLADALAEAGFPPVPGEWRDNTPPGASDPSAWDKRLHGGADPGRIVHLHLRAAGAPGWRHALLFRDWLRAEPAARDRYAAEKRRLAAAGLPTSAYAEAKTPWFDDALPAAERWAAATGWTP